MNIIIPTRGVIERLHTPRTLAAFGIKCVLVVHNDTTRKFLKDEGYEIVVSHTKSLVDKRNWILKNLVNKGEWFIGMDDNIRGFTCVKNPYYKNDENDTQGSAPKNKTWRQVYNAPINADEWVGKLLDSVQLARNSEIPLVGVATMENPYFRIKHYSKYRFVKTKVFAMCNTGKLKFKHKICMDSYLSALTVATYGQVLVNSFLHYKSKMYETGGLGTRKDREALGFFDILDSICKEFPGLVMPGKGGNTALRFRLTSASGVERWRKENGWL